MGIATDGYVLALQESAKKRSSGQNEPFYPKHFPKQSVASLNAKLRESRSSKPKKPTSRTPKNT